MKDCALRRLFLMNKNKWLAFIALCLVGTLLLSACVDMNTEVWVNPDNSGKMSLDLGLSSTLLNMAANQGGQTPAAALGQLAATLSANPSVTNVITREYDSAEYRHSLVEFDVPNLSALDLSTMEAAGGALQVKVTEIAVGEYTLQMQIEEQSMLSSLITQLPQGVSLTDPSIQAALIGRNFTVRVHVPKVVDTNGTVNPADQTVQWQVPIGQILAGDADMNFFVTYTLKPASVPPNPMYLIGAGILALVFILIATLLLVRRARNRRTQASWAMYGYRQTGVPPYPGAYPSFTAQNTQPTRARKPAPPAVPPLVEVPPPPTAQQPYIPPPPPPNPRDPQGR